MNFFCVPIGWASIKRHHGELWHVVDDSEWSCFSPQQLGVPVQDSSGNRLDVGDRDRRRTISQSSSYSVTFAGDDLGESDVLTSTPRRLTAGGGGGGGPGASHWETDSQPYSLEGSSIHFDSDSDHSAVLPSGSGSDAERTCRRAYTLPPSSHAPSGQEYVAQRSFSDSHYPPAEDLPSGLPTSAGASSAGQPKREPRIWTKLRMSLRLRSSKRSFLPNRSSTPPPSFAPTPPIQLIHIEPSAPLGSLSSADDTLSPVEDSESSDDDDDEGNDTPPHFHFDNQFNRIGSILNRLKSVQYKRRRLLNLSGCYIGLSLPVQLSQLYPPAEWFEPINQIDPSVTTTLSFLTIAANEETQYEHARDQCILCSESHPAQSNPSILIVVPVFLSILEPN